MEDTKGHENNKAEDGVQLEDSKQRVKRGKSPDVRTVIVCVCLCVYDCETWQNEAQPNGRSVPYVSWRQRAKEREAVPLYPTHSSWSLYLKRQNRPEANHPYPYCTSVQANFL